MLRLVDGRDDGGDSFMPGMSGPGCLVFVVLGILGIIIASIVKSCS